MIEMRAILRLLCLCALICMLGAGCKDDGVGVPEDPNTAKQKLAEFASVMHVSFPASTELLGYKWFRGGIDDGLIVKVGMTRESLEEFIENSPFCGKKLRTKADNPSPAIYPSFHGLNWWKVKDVNDWRSGEAMLPQAEGLKILIDLDDPEKVIIYLHWFET